MIYTALLEEGSLAVAALFLYFYIEPKIQKEKGFFTTRNICSLLISLPFMEFLIGFILQSSDCISPNGIGALGNITTNAVVTNQWCVGTPDIFSHSLTYDLFYLRVNDTVNGAHWIDYMFLPILYFVTYLVTKDSFFSALNAGFMVFLHEVIWFGFYWLKYYPAFQSEGWLNDIAFFILVCTLGFIGLKKYGKFYNNQLFFGGLGIFTVFLMYWYSVGFPVTVINNSQLGDGNHFLVTPFYNQLFSNELEVISWIIMFTTFLVNTLLIIRLKKF